VFEIVSKREVAPNVHETVIRAPAIAKKARPGQFVILMVDEKSERVPYTLCDWDRTAGTVTLVVQEVGQSSRKLVLLQAGDHVAHLVGPLGVPLEIAPFGTVALAGGCYGIGAVLGIARAMKTAGNRVITIVEADSHYLHYFRSELEAASDELIQTTIDGSDGIKGHSIDVVKRKLENGEQLDRVIAVGCLFMMMLAGNATKPFGVKTLVALNPIMLDGTGMCGACRVSVGGQTLFACVDGPFFDAHEVDWDELRDRRVAYSDAEIQAVARTDAVDRRRGNACVP
jgi:NAD(P)H-flavin reductase